MERLYRIIVLLVVISSVIVFGQVSIASASSHAELVFSNHTNIYTEETTWVREAFFSPCEEYITYAPSVAKFNLVVV